MELSCLGTAFFAAVVLLHVGRSCSGVTVTLCWDGSAVGAAPMGGKCPTTLNVTNVLFMPDRGFILVGGPDNLTLVDRNMNLLKFVNILPTADYSTCVRSSQIRGTPMAECTALPFLMAQRDDTNEVVVCDSGALKPKCRVFATPLLTDSTPSSWTTINDNIHTPLKYGKFGYGFVWEAVGDPSSRSASTLYKTGMGILTATVVDTGGKVVNFNPAIHPRPHVTSEAQEEQLFRPGKSPMKVVLSFIDNDYYYFLFRAGSPFCDAAKSADFAYIGRVCLLDPGVHQAGSEYLTYNNALKARVSCAVVVNGTSYTLTNITAAYLAEESQVLHAKDPVIYAAFSEVTLTPQGMTVISAMCLYTMGTVEKDLVKVFSPSRYNVYDSSTATSIVNMAPPACGTPESRVVILDMVTPGQSLYSDFGETINTFVVVEVPTRSTSYDVIFAGLVSGHIGKIVILHSINSSYVVSKTQVANEPIMTISVTDSAFSNVTIFASTRRSLAKAAAQNCNKYTTCRGCIELRDPHCGWSSETFSCVTIKKTGSWHQDIESGNWQSFCPVAPVPYQLLPPTPAAVSANVVMLQWRPIRPEPTSGAYERPRFVIYQDGSPIQDVRVGETTFNVTGLSGFTNYTFSILPKNNVSDGIMSNSVTVQTASAAPSPPILEASAVSYNRINVRWWRPLHVNGLLTGYTLSRGKEQGQFQTIQQVTSNLTFLEMTIADSPLETETGYRYQVAACTAGNGGGCTSSNIVSMTTLCQSPPAPSALQKIAVTADSLTLSWTPPAASAGKILSYSLYFYPSGQKIPGCCSAANTTFTVKHLAAFTFYSFTVQAATCAGLGTMSAVAQFQTSQAAPPAPKSVKAKFVSSASVTVTWAQPEPIYGILQDYKICRAPPMNSGCATVSNTTLSYSDMSIYTSIRPPACQQYNYTVEAATAAGSTVSLAAAAFVPGVPPAPSLAKALTNSASEIYLSWQLVSLNGCDVTGYSVYDSSGSRICCSRPQSSFVISNLDAYTQYQYNITAHTVYSGSSVTYWSTASNRTSEAAPTTPLPATPQYSVANNFITVKWQAPGRANGILQGYNIYRDGIQVGFYEQDLFWQEVLGVLSGGRRYKYQITALNSAGESLRLTINIVTPETLPSEPEVVNVVGSDYRKLTVSWLPPKRPNGIITHYMIEVREYLGQGTRSPLGSTPSPTASPVQTLLVPNKTQIKVIGSLQQNTTYLVSVTANNSAGFSNPTTGLPTTTLVLLAQVTTPPAKTFTATSKSAYNIFLSWTVNNDSFYQKYFVRQRDSSSVKDICCAGLQTSFDATGLSPYTNYTFEVVAAMRNGQNETIGRAEERTAQAAPTAPGNLQPVQKTENSVTLAWDAPKPANGEISGYRILLDSRSIGITAPETRSYQAQQLKADTTYNFQVRANTGNGNMAGPPSTIAAVRTSEGTPSSMPAPRTAAHNDSAMAVAWEPPAQPKGQITEYQVYYTTAEAANITCHLPSTFGSRLLSFNGSERYATITGLRSGHFYCVWTRARNSKLFGGWSSATIGQTQLLRTVPNTQCTHSTTSITKGTALPDTRQIDNPTGASVKSSCDNSCSGALIGLIVLGVLGGVLAIMLTYVIKRVLGGPPRKRRSTRTKRTPGDLSAVSPTHVESVVESALYKQNSILGGKGREIGESNPYQNSPSMQRHVNGSVPNNLVGLSLPTPPSNGKVVENQFTEPVTPPLDGDIAYEDAEKVVDGIGGSTNVQDDYLKPVNTDELALEKTASGLRMIDATVDYDLPLEPDIPNLVPGSKPDLAGPMRDSKKYTLVMRTSASDIKPVNLTREESVESQIPPPIVPLQRGMSTKPLLED